MIVLIGGEKGGSGKSTLTRNLAVWLKLQKKDVQLIDGDKQGSTYIWNETRKRDASLLQMPCLHVSGDIFDSVRGMDAANKIILIDTGGQDSETLRSAMSAAHKMLIPSQPLSDLETLPHMKNLVDKVKGFNRDLYVRTVLMRCPALPSQTKQILEAKEVCAAVGLPPLDAFTVQRGVYDSTKLEGKSVFEASDEKAIAEINEIAGEFFAWA